MDTASFRPQLSEPQWLQLDETIRRKLIQLFDIPQSGGRIIYASKLTSDGHTFKDLAVITIEKMQQYLGEGFESDTNYFDLFENVVAKLKDDNKTLVEKEAKKIETENIARWLMVMRGMKQQALELNLYQQFSELIKEIFSDVQLPVKKGPGRPRAKA
jgi:hypothetical protein